MTAIDGTVRPRGARRDAPAAKRLRSTPFVRPAPRPAWRRLAALAGFFLGLALPGAQAAEPARQEVRLGDVTAGRLLFRTTEPGVYLPAPVVMTDVRMQVGGLIARVTVSQRFYNPTDRWLEGVYVFPLPEDAAVDHMRMRIGERLVEGRIKPREEAKAIYERAKAEGRKAALIEQERPNLFTNSVANIGPGEDVMVQIEYQQTLRYDAGGFALRFPLVVAPRYLPERPGVATTVSQGGAAAGAEDDDPARISPPVLRPEAGAVNPVAIEVTLDAGFPLARLESPSHKIEIAEAGPGRRVVTLAEGAVAADRDFVLEWRPETGAAPGLALFAERLGGQDHLLLMLLPPERPLKRQAIPPRELIFVIDTSGSMAGPSIRQARQALKTALGGLRPDDRFNVIQFNDATQSLFPEAVAASPENLARAGRYVAGLEAEGGTNMAPALTRALASGGTEAGRLRQVVFLTDGAVGNEAELFALIHAGLGESRLFTVGIGSAPNSYFMRKAAAFGRGTFTHIGAAEAVGERMAALFAKLEAPVLTDLEVEFPGAERVEAWPRLLPDLYQGEPVVLAARLPRAAGRIRVTGKFRDEPWQAELPLAGGRESPGIATLWGRRKIEALMDSLHQGAKPEEVRQAVLEVALAHHLVSRYTSLVAVDATPSRPGDETVVRREVPLNLPAGWDFDKVFGTQPVQKTNWQPVQKAGLATMPRLAAEATPAGPVLNQLPAGATPATLKLLIGLLALLLGGLGLLLRPRRRAAQGGAA